MLKKTILAMIVLTLLAGCGVNNPFKDPPNIIFILTDDMDMTLMPYMEKTNQLIGEQGATFENHFVTTPLCCPSRASILRGQYAHNTDVLANAPGFVRFFKLRAEEDTLNVWLNEAGYRTALYGKYLNNYPVNAGQNYVPPGWTDWAAFLGTDYEGDLYFNYTLNENGALVEYGGAPEDYSTDVIRDKSLAFIEDSVEADSPFFLFVSVYAPHGPATAAPRHEALYETLAYPRKPSFDEEDLSDKPGIIRAQTETGDDFDQGDANVYFSARINSLRAVDELVEALTHSLEQNGLLENTYIIFTSDNGFRLGEHRIPSGKGTAYEEDIRVPLLLRGPGIQPGMRISPMTANIDFAPTIAELAGVRAPDFVDGRSFVPCLYDAEVAWRDGVLLEFGYIDEEALAQALQDPETDNLLADVAGGAFRGIRGGDYVYIEYANGEIEFYDLKADPYQLENLAGSLNPDTLARLRSKLEALKYCEGSGCRMMEEDLEIEVQ